MHILKDEMHTKYIANFLEEELSNYVYAIVGTADTVIDVQGCKFGPKTWRVLLNYFIANQIQIVDSSNKYLDSIIKNIKYNIENKNMLNVGESLKIPLDLNQDTLVEWIKSLDSSKIYKAEWTLDTLRAVSVVIVALMMRPDLQINVLSLIKPFMYMMRKYWPSSNAVKYNHFYEYIGSNFIEWSVFEDGTTDHPLNCKEEEPHYYAQNNQCIPYDLFKSSSAFDDDSEWHELLNACISNIFKEREKKYSLLELLEKYCT